MQLRQAAVILLTSTVVLTQLSGCAAVTPDKGIENSDDVTVVTEETNANSTAANADTVTVGGEQYDVSETPAEQVEQEEIHLTTEELHALFKKEYDSFKWAKENLGEYYKTDYLKLPAREIGTQTDANVYSDIEAEVAKPEYEGKILPDDGFAQYVSWRQQYEASLNKSTSTSNSTTAQEPSQQPSNNNNNSSGSGNQSQPSGGSTPSNNTGSNSSGIQAPPPGVDPDDWYETMNGGALKNDGLPKPDYEIVG